MPDFSVPATKPRNTPQRELLGSSHRVAFAVRGASSIRAMFHNVPVYLPPPPNMQGTDRLLSEHSYSSS